MAEAGMRARAARLEPSSTVARSVMAPAGLQALGDALNRSPRVIAQLKLAEQLSERTANGQALNGDPVLQGVFTYKGQEARDGALPGKTLPHGIKAKDAERLSRSARDFGTLTNADAFTAAIASLAPDEGVEIGPAAAAKAKAIAPYIELLPHLAGEEDGSEGKGGHLLVAMQAKWGARLHVVGPSQAAAAWECTWNLLKDPEAEAIASNMTFASSKRSTMFPASWTEDELKQQLQASNVIGTRLVLQPSDIEVEKKGDTFYPKKS